MVLDPSFVDRLKSQGQAHLLRWWDRLTDEEQTRLVADLSSINFEEVRGLVSELVHGEPSSASSEVRVEPVEVTRLPQTDGERVAWRRAAEVGAEILAAGEVAIVLVAGGSGTRLGYEGPKGTYPIGPVSSASLFQIHAEKVLALGRRYGKVPPFYIMTSPENHQTTVDFFQTHKQFGLEHVRFFVQGQMPAVDLENGRILLADRGRVAMSPDGHGGTLAALAQPGPNGSPSCLGEMRERGIRTLYYFQVDNPLAKIADPAFLGLHRQANSEMSFKVVERLTPEEKMGVVVLADSRPQVIEYSDLSPELAARRAPEGHLELWAGSIAIHLVELPFVERLLGEHRMPYHRAIKKVPYIDGDGQLVNPDKPNGVKFEQFIFDALPQAGRWAIVETDRAGEFEPLKNATGPDSPATIHQRMSDLFGNWLEQAGVSVPRRPDGSVPVGIEISPLFALDAAELRGKVDPNLVIDEPTYLHERSDRQR